ncbi:MAG: hypothetical protein IJX94_05490 [Clostridia bacterium]|nr:hypothetical protein [Clostridia bacterium]
MKKKLSLLLLTAILLLPVTGCHNTQAPEAQTSLPEETASAPTAQFVEDDSYLEIDCEKISGYKQLLLSFGNNDPSVLITSIPKSWSLIKLGSGSYNIQKNNLRIGSLCVKEQATVPVGAVGVYQKEELFSGVTTKHVIHRYGTDAVSFRHHITFSYQSGDGTDHSIVLDVDYKELNQTAATRLFYSAERKNKRTGVQLGLARLTKSSPTVMILGNSFISKSNIGSILSDMCHNNCTVEAVSIGFATVSHTYSQDTARLNRIRNGEVDAVFLCGFYSPDDASALGPIVDACKASGAKLVLFPAHNEDKNDVAEALRQYDYPILLDWKGELDALIESGVARSELAQNDTFGHSTPLAGYVGAHMIYRSIFGKIPPALDTDQGLTQAQVNQALGDYAATGDFPLVDESLIYDMS